MAKYIYKNLFLNEPKSRHYLKSLSLSNKHHKFELILDVATLLTQNQANI